MPFTRIDHPMNGAYAFQAERTSVAKDRHQLHEYSIPAYWYEIKKGKTIACYGAVGIGVDPGSISGSPLELFAQLLELADNQHGAEVSHCAIVKLGHTKPYKSDWAYEYMIDEGGLDDQALAQMLANPNFTPPGTDAWWKKPPSYSSAKFWAEADKLAGR
jgi:hypothetical protein